MTKKLLVSLLLVGMLLFVCSCSEGLIEEEASPTSTSEQEEESLPVSTTEVEDPAEHSTVFFSLEDFQSQSHISAVVNTEVGEEFKVVLGANPTSGFQWQENVGIDNESIIKQIDHKFVAAGTDMPGSPGQDIWTFEALKKGTTTISIECSRPWEDRSLGTLEIAITIIVE